MDHLVTGQRRRRARVSPDSGATGSADTPPDTVQPGAGGETVSPPTGDPGLAHLARLVREQAERLEVYAARIDWLESELEQARTTIRQLQAPAVRAIRIKIE